jgi:hypothetical protein
LKVGLTVVKKYAQYMKEQKIKHAIFVVQEKPTLFAQTSINEMVGTYRIEVFQVHFQL